MTCAKNFKIFTRKTRKKTFSGRELRSLKKNPCCEHITLLLERIQEIIIERETWHEKFNIERNVVNRLAKKR